LPVPAYNTFNEVLDSLDAADDDSANPFKTELIRPKDFIIQNWPPQPGDYCVFNATKSIALVLLQGNHIDEPDLTILSSKIAISGSITTENRTLEWSISSRMWLQTRICAI